MYLGISSHHQVVSLHISVSLNGRCLEVQTVRPVLTGCLLVECVHRLSAVPREAECPLEDFTPGRLEGRDV